MRGLALAIGVATLLTPLVMLAQSSATFYGPPPPPAMPNGYTRELTGVSGVDAPQFVLWRPAKPSETLLVVAEEEPSLASIARPDLLQIARERGMTILFAGETARLNDFSAATEKLRETISGLRRTAQVKKVVGSAIGNGADLLQKLALEKDGELFEALLLAGGAPLKADSKSSPFIIDLYGSDAFWRSSAHASPPPVKARNRRSFFVAGAVVSPAPANNCSAPLNDRSIEAARRALLAALDDYLRGGPTPPPSRDATVAPAGELKWPKIPNMPAPPRDAHLAPAIDSDGNETSGLRLPDQALPIATFTGWNAAKDPSRGDCAVGAKFPFPVSRAAREVSGDPRQSLPERYGSRAYFVAALRSVADKLVKERLLLPQDADAYVAEGKKAPF